MNNVCFISKYPPIQGGESSKAYWLTQGLGSKGNNIHIFTNSLEVENEYRENFIGNDLDFYMPRGVDVHSTNPFQDISFIPQTNPYSEKIANIAIDGILKNNLKIIDAWYLLPYGIAGLIVKKIFGLPLILRHAGSDITRLLNSSSLSSLLTELLLQADRIITYPIHKDFFLKLGIPEQKIYINKNISVNTKVFSPTQIPLDLNQYTDKYENGKPVILFIGKSSPSKGIYDLIEALSCIKEDFLLLIVTGGSEIYNLKEMLVEKGLESKSSIIGFLPPWRVPSLYRASTCVVCPERDFPIRIHRPIVPREVMACGTCLVESDELYLKKHSSKIVDEENVLVVNPHQHAHFSSLLNRIIRDPESAKKIGNNGSKISLELEKFDEYITDIENLYSELLY